MLNPATANFLDLKQREEYPTYFRGISKEYSPEAAKDVGKVYSETYERTRETTKSFLWMTPSKLY